MIRCAATAPGAPGRSAPVPDSGTSAPAATSTGPTLSTTRTRFGTQPLPAGAGSTPASASADHTSPPVASPKPPIGFQAAAGRDAVAIRSQPFHGKSFSFTVRRKTAESSPVWSS